MNGPDVCPALGGGREGKARRRLHSHMPPSMASLPSTPSRSWLSAAVGGSPCPLCLLRSGGARDEASVPPCFLPLPGSADMGGQEPELRAMWGSLPSQTAWREVGAEAAHHKGPSQLCLLTSGGAEAGPVGWGSSLPTPCCLALLTAPCGSQPQVLLARVS